MYFTKRKLAARYDRSIPTISRWLANGTYPKPDFYINGKATWKEETVEFADTKLIRKEPFQYGSSRNNV